MSTGPETRFRNTKIALFVLVVAAWLTPVYWLVNVALKTQSQLFVQTPTFIFEPTFENFSLAIYKFGILRNALNSLIIASGATAITLVFATLLVYGITRFRFRARNPLLMWILNLRMLPPIAIVIPYYVLYSQVGLIDTFPGLILAYLPLTLPLAVWLLYGFAQDIPRSIDEAARIDGANRWQVFRDMVLPLMRPAIAVAGTFCFLEVWNEFTLALILTGSQTKTVPIGMSQFLTEHSVEWGPMAAAALLLLLPLLVVTYFLQRSLVRGLTLGAVR
ncbi:MAG: carbohydrate ABC transporter permease [Rhizobiaceae bacterium]|nr:carbohydrate ABC transporter permease [Rhizobiaceae bacterium]